MLFCFYSEKVKDLQMLVDSVQSDKSTLEDVIEKSEGSLDNVTHNIDTIRNDLETVREYNIYNSHA